MGLSLRKRRQAQGRRREACDIPRRHQRRVQEAPQRVGWRSTTTTTDHSSPAEATCATSSRGSMSKAQTWQVLVAEAPTAEVSVAQASLALKYVESAAATGVVNGTPSVHSQPLAWWAQRVRMFRPFRPAAPHAAPLARRGRRGRAR